MTSDGFDLDPLNDPVLTSVACPLSVDALSESNVVSPLSFSASGLQSVDWERQRQQIMRNTMLSQMLSPVARLQKVLRGILQASHHAQCPQDGKRKRPPPKKFSMLRSPTSAKRSRKDATPTEKGIYSQRWKEDMSRLRRAAQPDTDGGSSMPGQSNGAIDGFPTGQEWTMKEEEWEARNTHRSLPHKQPDTQTRGGGGMSGQSSGAIDGFRAGQEWATRDGEGGARNTQRSLPHKQPDREARSGGTSRGGW